MNAFRTEWIETLAAVKEYRSFTAVARLKGVSTMAISKQIAQFEARVNEPLVNRSTRSLTLTEAGESILQRSEVLLAEKEAIRAWLEERHQQPSGKLKVVVLEEYALANTLTPWMGEFLKRYPKITVELKTLSNITELADAKADVYWGLGRYLGEIFPGLKRKPLLKARYGIYASPEYLNEYGTPETPKDLTGHFVIGSSHNLPNNMLVVKDGKDFKDEHLEGVYLNTKIICDNNALAFAAQGIGIINCTEAMFTETNYRAELNLVPILEPYWLETIEAFVYYHQTKIEQPKVRAFIDFFYSKREQW